MVVVDLPDMDAQPQLTAPQAHAAPAAPGVSAMQPPPAPHAAPTFSLGPG